MDGSQRCSHDADRPWTVSGDAAATTRMVRGKSVGRRYVFADEGDGDDVADAMRYGRAAHLALAQELVENPDPPQGDGAAPAPAPPGPLEATLEPLESQTNEAALAHGRAAALCAQHLALGASTLESENWQDLFVEGRGAFEAARRDGDGLQRARAAAGLAELWFFRRADISLMNRGDAAATTWIFRGDESPRRRGCDADIPWRYVAATPRLRRGHSVETPRRGSSVETAARRRYCEASAMSLRLRTGAQVEAVRQLARRSIAKTKEALREIRALGLGETRVAATMLKDLGKVHGFTASIFGGDDAAEGRARLAEALAIQTRLDKAHARETANILRLLRAPGEAGRNAEVVQAAMGGDDASDDEDAPDY